jgi:hypothetical protein
MFSRLWSFFYMVSKTPNLCIEIIRCACLAFAPLPKVESLRHMIPALSSFLCMPCQNQHLQGLYCNIMLRASLEAQTRV